MNTTESTASMLVYEESNEKLITYTDVPGLPPSDKFAIRVRSAATDNQWVPIFVHKTYNRQQELGDVSVPKTDGSILATGVKNYLFFTGAWSHSYGNIEMTPNSPVEVEISSVNGFKIRNQDFFKAAVYPPHKASPAMVTGNKVYFTINNPSQIVIDINGNMDDSNKALINLNDRSDIRHTVSLFANPIMEKPSLTDTANVIAVEPGAPRPSDNLGTKTTLYFKPGVHQLGLDFKVRPGNKYYIPGDALVYGTFNNNDVPDGGGLKSGQNIKVYGYGTISGQYTDHPDYVVGSVQDHYKGLIIRNALNTEVNGICFADPANHSCNIAAWGGRPDKSVPATFVRWAKVISWRGNGDGFGNQHLTEDCFLRTNDDAGYIKGTKRRCTYWKDTSAAVYHMAGIPDPADFFPIVIEDCDVVYNRARTADGQVGGVFHNRAEGIVGQHTVDVTVRNFRIHDRLANRPVFNMFSKRDADLGSSYWGITFQNISIASSLSICTLTGFEEAPWYGGITFDNVTFDGELLTQGNFETYFNTNSYVSGVVFTQSNTHDVALTQPQNGYVASSSSLVDIPTGTTVILTAIPREGFQFSGWSGAVSGTTNPISLVVGADMTVSATFSQELGPRYEFDTPGTNSLIIPSGASSAKIEVWGAGGAGGSAFSGIATQNTQARGGGGSGGSYASVTMPVAQGQTIEYTVGAGGMGAASGFTHQTIGQSGGASTVFVDGVVKANAVGGTGGENISIVNAIVGGQGGAASTSGNSGEVKHYGGNGGTGGPGGTGGGGGSAGSSGNGGAGGISTAGAAGPDGGAVGGIGVNLTSGGNSGGAPGAGGSGAAVRNNTPFDRNNRHETGGKGGDGKVIVTFYENPIYYPLTTTAFNGSVNPASGSYEAGSTVSISAIPDPGYRFTGWTGDLSGTEISQTLIIDGPQSVTANFIRTYTLLTNAGVGGTITPASGSVYDESSTVDAEAIADPGYRFAGWSGALAGNQAATTLTMDGDKTINASFVRTYKLMTNAGIGGSVTPNSGSVHDENSTVDVEAIPDPGYRFAGWSGALADDQAATTLTMDGDKTINASFVRTYTLTTNAGIGGSITPNSGSFHDENSTVDLEAIADPGYRFAGWSGALAGNQAATTLTMDGDKTINASFVRTYTLMTNAGIGGSITPNSGSIHDENSTVDMEAIADPGYRFAGWSGALTGNQNPAALTMNSDMQVDASFELIVPVLTSRISGNEIILSWPVLSPSWTLQWSTALDQESWNDLIGPYQTNGDENSWQEPATHDRRFFRLMHP